MDELFPSSLNPESLAFLNGRWSALSDARVSVLDRGFLLGDGVYEVVPVYARRPFRWAAHYARLRRSLDKLEIQCPLTETDWSEVVTRLVRAQSFDDQLVYIQVTRGVAKRDHAFPQPAVAPTLFAMSSPMTRPSTKERTQGIAAITLPDERWHRCDIKSVALLGNVLARQAAVSQGAQEAILFRSDFLTEGAACNVWLVIEGALVGSRRSSLVLEGIRYDLFEELCEEVGVTFSLRDVSRAEFDAADEVMISSASKEILPVTVINGQPVFSGNPGPVYLRLRQAYDSRLTALLQDPAL